MRLFVIRALIGVRVCVSKIRGASQEEGARVRQPRRRSPLAARRSSFPLSLSRSKTKRPKPPNPSLSDHPFSHASIPAALAVSSDLLTISYTLALGLLAAMRPNSLTSIFCLCPSY